TRRGGVNGLAWSPDGATLATADEKASVSLWDAATGAPGRRLSGHDGRATAVVFSPDGRLLASAGQDDMLRLWNVATGHETAVRAVAGVPIRQLAWSADGRRLAATGECPPGAKAAALVWELPPGGRGATARVTLRLETGSGEGVALSPDGRLLAAADHDGALIWDGETGRLLRRFTSPGSSPKPLAFTRDGRRLLAGCSDGVVRL